MLFLVDGYNVTKGDPATQGLALEDQREALIARLRARGEQLLGRGRIVVVFDGESGREQGSAAARSATYPIEVVFSRGVTADDAIVKRATHASGEQVCLVSSDRGLAERMCAHLGKRLEVRPREAVYDSARGTATAKPHRDDTAREAGLPKGANEITKELKDLWLTDEE